MRDHAQGLDFDAGFEAAHVVIKAAESRLRLKYGFPTMRLMHVYEVRPRKDKRGVPAGIIESARATAASGYGEPNAVSNAIGYAEHRSRSHEAVIRVTGNVIETHEH